MDSCVKLGWISLALMVAVGAAYIPLQQRAEDTEFALKTTELIHPQISASIRRMPAQRAKSELLWFQTCSEGLRADFNRKSTLDCYQSWLFN